MPYPCLSLNDRVPIKHRPIISRTASSMWSGGCSSWDCLDI